MDVLWKFSGSSLEVLWNSVTERPPYRTLAVVAPLSREAVLDAAMSVVETDGVDALSMRRLAAKLGVAPTAIYWHVGNRDELLDALVDRIGDEVGRVRTSGRTPEARILSTARSLLASIESHRPLVGLAHQRDRLGSVLAPAQDAIGAAFGAAGLRGARCVDATNAVIQVVLGYSITELYRDRSPAIPLWDGERTFGVSLKAVVRGLLP